MLRFRADQRNIAIGNLQAGMSIDRVARAFGVHRSTIADSGIGFRVLAVLPSTQDQTDLAAQDRAISRAHRGDSFRTASQTNEMSSIEDSELAQDNPTTWTYSFEPFIKSGKPFPNRC